MVNSKLVMCVSSVKVCQWYCICLLMNWCRYFLQHFKSYVFVQQKKGGNNASDSSSLNIFFLSDWGHLVNSLLTPNFHKWQINIWKLLSVRPYALVCTSGWSDAWILFPLAPMDWYIASWEFSLIWMLWSKQKNCWSLPTMVSWLNISPLTTRAVMFQHKIFFWIFKKELNMAVWHWSVFEWGNIRN